MALLFSSVGRNIQTVHTIHSAHSSFWLARWRNGRQALGMNEAEGARLADGGKDEAVLGGTLFAVFGELSPKSCQAIPCFSPFQTL